MKRKKNIGTIENWVKMIDHINEGWKKAWNPPKEHSYPFLPKDFKDLKHFAKFYHPWGVMALWDIYIDTANDFLRKNGLTIYHFTTNLPRLLDNRSFKSIAAGYEKGMAEDHSLDLFEHVGLDLKLKQGQP